MRSVGKIRGEGQIATKLSSGKHRIALALAAAAVCGVGGLSNATLATTTDTWTGAASTDWATIGNWNGDNPPVSGDALEFSSANSAGTNTLADSLTSSTFVIAGITYDLGSPAYVQTGNAFELTGAITDNETTNPQTINNNVTLGASEIFTTASGASLNFGGVISGTGFGVTASGGGVTTLAAANTFTGPTTVSASSNLSFAPAATFSMANAVSVGSGGTLTYTLNATNLLTVTGATNNSGTILLNGTGVSNTTGPAAGTIAYDPQVQGSGSVVVNLGSSLSTAYFDLNNSTNYTLNGSNATSGSVVVKSGIAWAQESSTNGGFGQAAITLGDADGKNDGNTLNATLENGNSWNNAINVVGTGSGMNIVESTSNRTYSGAITLSNANVVLSAGYNYNTGQVQNFTGSLTGTGNVTIQNPSGGSTSTYTANMTISDANFNPVGSVTTAGANAVTISAPIGSNVTSFVQGSTNTTTLSGASAFTGTTTIDAGTLSLNSTGKLASSLISITGNASTTATLALLSATALSNSSPTISVTTGTGVTPKITLTYSGTITLFALDINGTPVAPGTYGSGTNEPTADPTLFNTSTGTFTVPAPEPASLGVLGLGGLIMMRRRRVGRFEKSGT